MYLNNKTYDTLKWVAQFLLPAFATMYFAVSGIWGLPYTEQIVGTVVAFDAFLGALLGISNMQYQEAKYMENQRTLAYGDAPPQYIVEELPDNYSGIKMTSQTYDMLKWIGLTLLPALGAFYLALGQLWAFPFGQEVVGTVAAVSTFLGVLLGVSRNQLIEAVSG